MKSGLGHRRVRVRTLLPGTGLVPLPLREVHDVQAAVLVQLLRQALTDHNVPNPREGL